VEGVEVFCQRAAQLVAEHRVGTHRHVVAVLLHRAEADDDRVASLLYLVPDLGPGERVDVGGGRSITK
jgi:hypothetical protein